MRRIAKKLIRIGHGKVEALNAERFMHAMPCHDRFCFLS